MWTVIVRDPQGSELYRLPLSGRLVVGRTHDCQIVLQSTAISRQHARIELFKDRPVFVDLGSSNGSTLNGQPLTKPTLMDDKSRIEIAGFQIGFERAGAVVTPPPAPAADAPPPAAPPPADAVPAKPAPAVAKPAPPQAAAPAPQPAAPTPQPAAPTPPSDAPAASPPGSDDDLDLVPIAPSIAPPKRAASLSDTGMNFLDLPGAPSPTESAPKPKAHADSAIDLLDQQLAGIRTYRGESSAEAKARQEQLDSEWKQVLVSMRQLHDKVGKHPKIHHFTFSRDEQEVSVKVADSSQRGYSYYVLARRHPSGKYDSHDVVWLCEFGGEERNYKLPKEAMADLVRRLAPRLA